MVVVVAVCFVVVVVVVGRGELVAVELGTAVVDVSGAVVVVESAVASPVEGVPFPGATAVVTVAAAVVSVVRPACSAGFDPCEEAPATPTQTGANQMRTCAHRGSLRKRFQRLMSDGKGQA